MCIAMHCHVHFDCAGSHKITSGTQRFSCKFSREMALVTWHVHVHVDCAGPRKTRELTQKSCQENMYRELVQRSCQETSYGDLVQRSCQETFYRDLAQESSYRDQRSCQETSSRDLVQRLGEESSDLAQRSFIESLNWDLTLRSLTEIFCGHLFWAPCTDSLTQGSCIEASTENLSRRSCARSSTDIFTQGTCNLTWHLFFQRPPWMNMLSLLGSLVSC